MADVALAYRSGTRVPIRDPILACAVFGFSLWAVIGAGADAAYWNHVLLLLGVPLYGSFRMRNECRTDQSEAPH